MRVHRHHTPIRIRPRRTVRERQVRTRRRIERQIDVVHDVLLVIALAVHVVDRERRYGANLMLDADRCLERTR